MSTSTAPVSSPYTATGGARVGWLNSSWPLARLTATPERLSVSVFLSGKYEFVPQEVVAIERYTMIPVLGWGVRIVHSRSDYPQNFIFWNLAGPEPVLRGIREAGFSPSAPAADIPPRLGIPVRWSVIIGLVVAWNGLFMLDFGRTNSGIPIPGLFVCVALLLVLILSLATLRLPAVQRVVLKPGRHLGEIRGVLGLLAVVSGFLLVIFSIITASGGFSTPRRGEAKQPLPEKTEPAR